MGKNLSTQKTWNEKDEKFLKENYGKIKTVEIANKLQRTNSSVYSHIHKIGLAKKTDQLSINEIDVASLEEITTVEKTIIENNSLAYSVVSLEKAYEEKCKENKRLIEAMNKLNESFVELRKVIK